MHPDLSKNDNSADIHNISATISPPPAVEGKGRGLISKNGQTFLSG